jgi:hypothetical protein
MGAANLLGKKDEARAFPLSRGLIPGKLRNRTLTNRLFVVKVNVLLPTESADLSLRWRGTATMRNSANIPSSGGNAADQIFLLRS